MQRKQTPLTIPITVARSQRLCVAGTRLAIASVPAATAQQTAISPAVAVIRESDDADRGREQDPAGNDSCQPAQSETASHLAILTRPYRSPKATAWLYCALAHEQQYSRHARSPTSQASGSKVPTASSSRTTSRPSRRSTRARSCTAPSSASTRTRSSSTSATSPRASSRSPSSRSGARSTLPTRSALGDEIDALVLTKEDAEGRLILSKKRARFELAWKAIEGRPSAASRSTAR